MDFEEFLWAMGEDALAAIVRSAFERETTFPDDLHRKASRLWREYMLVGRMPQAVEAYLPGRDMAAAERAKRTVLRLYHEDIEKYGGLALSEDDATVKCYLADTGLLSSMAFAGAGGSSMPRVYRQVLLGNTSVNEGMLAENAVAQQFVAAGHALHFYSRWSSVAKDRMEVDFLLILPFPDAAMKPRVTPAEVKSGKRYSTVSLDKFGAKFGKRVGTELVFQDRPARVEGNRGYLPLDMSFCVD